MPGDEGVWQEGSWVPESSFIGLPASLFVTNDAENVRKKQSQEEKI